MLHERLIATVDGPNLTGGVREQLGTIVSGIDARFVAVGTGLATTVETIDRIVLALRQVGTLFEEGDAAAAVGNLMQAAERLTDVSAQVTDRTREIRLIRSFSSSLCKNVDEVRKALEVLHIYGMNVKIAASGAEDFVDFADRMQKQLRDGEVGIGGFDIKLAELEKSLAGMEESDRQLALECARVVPQVPEQLIANARALLAHQRKLVDLTNETGRLAAAIQGNVCVILGAVQIGDIARQRLEHILSGCAFLDATLPGCEAQDGAATRHHLLRMLAAQTFDTAADFRRETKRLTTSLREIEPQAAGLLALQAGNGADKGQVFLRRMEAGIAEADAMTTQLRHADRKAEETIRVIVDTVEDIATRAAVVRNLRIDVQQMAINIGLRCRRREGIGRPVTVIANEIRGYSERLDVTIDSVTQTADELNAISLRMRGEGREDMGKPGTDLSQPLEAIRLSAAVAEEAMASVDSQAGDIVGILRRTTDQLEESLDLAGTIDAIGAALADLAGPDMPVSDRGDHPFRRLMADIGSLYTMARERDLHDQFRLPDMMSIGGFPVTNSATDEDDDDALFDDALF